MTTSDARSEPDRSPRPARAGLSDALASIPAVVVIAPTVALSAFLLFVAEPLVGRLALPAFGGAPGVWATVLAFFQGVLLLGYLYGHVSVTRLGIRRGALVHVGVSAVAVASLLAAPVDVAGLRNESFPPALDLLLVLGLTIGPAAFLLTATTPLLSAWYVSLADDAEGRSDPYWLYALSNGGSLLALLAYPFLIEPLLGLSAQRGTWAVAFGVLWLLIAVNVLLVLVRGRERSSQRADALADTTSSVSSASTLAEVERIDGRRRLRWILLAAIPSGLLAAVTNVIATDLVSAPLLWVGPLAIYLLTFVIAFSERGRRIVPRARWLAPVAITLLWVPFGSAAAWPIVPLLLVEYGGFAVVALALHGRLALDRPAPVRLTEFYLLLALGGVLGGSFVAIVAPLAFKGIWEYPILLVAALAMLAWGAQGTPDRSPAGAVEPPARRPRRGLNLRPFVAGAPDRLIPYVAVAIPLGLALVVSGSVGLESGVRWLVVGGLILLVGGQPRFLALSTALVLVLGAFIIPRDVVFQDRSFFGVTEVLRPAGATVTSLMNGTTLHGVQSTDPDLRRSPMTYYARTGPIGDVFEVIDDGWPAGARSIGVVGLGAGTMATYVRPGDSMSFYEIDPIVARVASDTSYFTYLADASTTPRVVLGDARLTLEKVPAATHDVVVLDAFSSDAIPVHLMTVEAFREYARVLKPGGVLAMHVSNRYYDLAGAVGAAAEQAGLSAFVRSYQPSDAERAAGASPSVWVAGTNDRVMLASLSGQGWTPVGAGVAPLTDDFADLLRFLRPGTW
jgi:SAM-dependent methyltransferase